MNSSIFSRFTDSVATDVELRNSLKKIQNFVYLKADVVDET